jgi:hypothetical protein
MTTPTESELHEDAAQYDLGIVSQLLYNDNTHAYFEPTTKAHILTLKAIGNALLAINHTLTHQPPQTETLPFGAHYNPTSILEDTTND